MPTHLSIRGSFDPDRLQRAIGLSAYSADRKGELRKGTEQPYEWDACAFDVSDADFEHFEEQLADIEVFLTRHYDGLQQLEQFDIVSMYIDVGYDSGFGGTDHVTDFRSLPSNLLRLLGTLGIGLELSAYWFDRFPEGDGAEDHTRPT